MDAQTNMQRLVQITGLERYAATMSQSAAVAVMAPLAAAHNLDAIRANARLAGTPGADRQLSFWTGAAWEEFHRLPAADVRDSIKGLRELRDVTEAWREQHGVPRVSEGSALCVVDVTFDRPDGGQGFAYAIVASALPDSELSYANGSDARSIVQRGLDVMHVYNTTGRRMTRSVQCTGTGNATTDVDVFPSMEGTLAGRVRLGFNTFLDMAIFVAGDTDVFYGQAGADGGYPQITGPSTAGAAQLQQRVTDLENRKRKIEEDEAALHKELAVVCSAPRSASFQFAPPSGRLVVAPPMAKPVFRGADSIPPTQPRLAAPQALPLPVASLLRPVASLPRLSAPLPRLAAPQALPRLAAPQPLLRIEDDGVLPPTHQARSAQPPTKKAGAAMPPTYRGAGPASPGR